MSISGKSCIFGAMLAAQFLLFVADMFVDIKIGVFSAVLVAFFSVCCVVVLYEDLQTNWKAGQTIMTFLLLAWAFYYLIELLNPNNLMEAWNINFVPYVLIPLLCAFLVPSVIHNKKEVELLLFIWSAFVLVFTFKGYWQKNHGFSAKDLYFLFNEGGARTHIIWSGIRYFSCFSDAANYGVHAAMATVVFFVSALFADRRWKRLYFLFIAWCGIYGLGISGTRASMGVLMGGIMMLSVIVKSWKVLLGSLVLGAAVFCFFRYTHIGSGNAYVYKMRTAFHPTADGSYQVRLENRRLMRELMKKKILGYGIGLSKPGNFRPKEVMPLPPDSWFVSVWVETGLIGLLLYMLIHGTLFACCIWTLMFKVHDLKIRGLIGAWLCMDAGFFIAAYISDVMQYPNQLPVYIGFALCLAAPQIEKQSIPQKANV
jgi:hypothetical protein